MLDFPTRYAKAPEEVSELLTLRSASARYGVDKRQIWAWAARGLLHAVRPYGRILYPAWELEALLGSHRATYPGLAESGRRAAAAA